ncbi:MAG: hypothetical protein V1841_02455 [Patescibacteria group bacterium]
MKNKKKKSETEMNELKLEQATALKTAIVLYQALPAIISNIERGEINVGGMEPHQVSVQDPDSGVSINFNTDPKSANKSAHASIPASKIIA